MHEWKQFLENYSTQRIPQPIHCVMDLSYLGLIKVSGARAKELLQGQLTCHLEEISAFATRLGAHCNPQGRIISLFRVFFYQNHYYLQMPLATIPLAIQALKKYAVFYKVELTDASNELLRMGYAGSSEIIAKLPESADQCLLADQLLVIKLPGLIPRYQFLGDFPAISRLWKRLTAEKISYVAESFWHQLDLEAAIPSIYPETCEKFLPHDINLPGLNGVSFNKGCYTGQEIIARMEYLGKKKSKLLLASIETSDPPVRGSDIFNESGVAGNIVDYCKIGYNNYETLITSNKNDRTFFIDADKTRPLVLKQAQVE